MYPCERTFFCGEIANKHDLSSSTSYLVSHQLFVVVISGGEGGGLLLYCMQPGLFIEIYVMSAVITFYSVIVQF